MKTITKVVAGPLRLMPLLICVFGGASGCSHSILSKTTADAPVAVGTRPNEHDLLRASVAFQSIDVFGDKIWSGFSNGPKALVVVRSDSQCAINLEELPSYYTRVALPQNLSHIKTVGCAEGFHNVSGEVSTPPTAFRAFAVEPSFVSFHYKSGFASITSLDLDPKSEWSSEDWIQVAVHELFHLYQDMHIDYKNPRIRRAEELDQTKLKDLDWNRDDFLKKDIVPELEVLSQAACPSTSAKEAKALLKKALKMRDRRFIHMRKAFKVEPLEFEPYLTFTEGTAKYVEVMSDKYWKEFAKTVDLSRDPKYKHFAQLRDMSRIFCETPQAKDVSKYWYFLGVRYTAVLEKLSLDWKSVALNSPDFFEAVFRRFNLR